MDLTIQDVADLLNVSENAIHRWVSEGKIPFYRIQEQYLFNRMEIENWVMKLKLENSQETLPFNSSKKTHEEKIPLKGGLKQFSLFRAIHKGGILYDIPGTNKEDVIRTSVRVLARDLNLDAEGLTELLLDRENLQPTALNWGIGIPHTRDFLLDAHHDVVTIVFPRSPIPYGALDGKPVHTLFFLFACDDKRHLHLLAKIAHLSSQPEIQKLLSDRPSKEHLLEFIKGWESKI